MTDIGWMTPVAAPAPVTAPPTPPPAHALGAPEFGPPTAAPLETYASAFGPPNPAVTIAQQIESSLSVMDQARNQLQGILEQPRLAPTDPGYVAQANREFAQFMDLQLTVARAGFGLELASKTIEVGTNGINTLSRTQT